MTARKLPGMHVEVAPQSTIVFGPHPAIRPSSTGSSTKNAVVAVAAIVGGLICGGFGALLAIELRSEPVVASEPGVASHPAPSSPAPSALPPLPTLVPMTSSDIPPPAGMTNPDMEVCRSINTTCGGEWPQYRCYKGRTSWSALLSDSQVNCVVAAQGLVDRNDRASWIRGCGAGINCY